MSKLPLKDLSFPICIDGGLSNVLEELGCNLNNKLWVANLLTTNPEAIIKTHLAYLDAGAQIISTTSYQATIPGFMKLGYSKEDSERLILRSVELAETAIKKYLKTHSPNKKPIIAGSIGPYGAYLADGSEYRGNYNISDSELIDFHKRRIELLDNSECDLLAFETIPSIEEAKVISQLTKNCTSPSWVSFSCKDGNHINDGTPIVEAAKIFIEHPNIFAIGVNCTKPQHISNLIMNLKSVLADKNIIIYPNSGEVYNAETKTWSGISNPTIFQQQAEVWIDLGANIIGGCCQIGPKHIKSICTLPKEQ